MALQSFSGLTAVFKWSESERSWKKLAYALPRGTSIVDAEGRDAGIRFIDVNGDGYDDVLFSNEDRFSLHLFIPKANPRLMWEVGWNDEVWAGERGGGPLPAVVHLERADAAPPVRPVPWRAAA